MNGGSLRCLHQPSITSPAEAERAASRTTAGFRASLPRPVPSRKSPAEAGAKERHGTFEGHPVMRQRADAIVVPA
jgi:hypothetical protein